MSCFPTSDSVRAVIVKTWIYACATFIWCCICLHRFGKLLWKLISIIIIIIIIIIIKLAYFITFKCLNSKKISCSYYYSSTVSGNEICVFIVKKLQLTC
jgi:hypothetical protein